MLLYNFDKQHTWSNVMIQHCDIFTVESEINQDNLHQNEITREIKVRLDKWLWAARFFKTRALARAAIERGKVLYNGELVSPSTEIQLEATVQIRLGRFSKDLIITGLSTRRKNSNDALSLFEVLPIQDAFPDGLAKFHPNNMYSNEYSIKKPKKIVRFLRRNVNRHYENA